MNTRAAIALGALLAAGLIGLGYLLGGSAIKYREFERTVTVKGLSEQEHPADIIIWPIRFTVADNDLGALYERLESQTDQIRAYLTAAGIVADGVTVSTPAIVDKSAQQYGSGDRSEFRYTGTRSVTVYSDAVTSVRQAMPGLAALGKQGIALSGEDYENKPEYLFMRLNEIKPEMIEQATTKAREVAQKFATDSNSRLGKIKRASQGQFSISERDKNNPHIKNVRVVSTVEYYLVD